MKIFIISAEEEYMELLGKETVNDVELNEGSANGEASPKPIPDGQQIDPAEAIKPAVDADGNEIPKKGELKIPRTVNIDKFSYKYRKKEVKI